MNTAEVEDLGRLLQRSADRLAGVLGDLDRLVNLAAWLGDDAGAFLQSWPTYRAKLLAAGEGLRAFGESAMHNASAQLEASADWGGTGSPTSGAALPTDWSTMSAELRLRSLDRLGWNDAATAWATVSPEEQRAIAIAGAAYGSLDFVDPDIRFAINRELVFQEHARIEAIPEGDRSNSEANRYGLYGRLLEEHQQVLFFDPAGDGRIGVVHGDLHTASEIAVQVPGVHNTLDNYWGMLEASQRLHGSAGGEGVAVVSWLGYENPSGLGEPLVGGFADGGATSLGSLVRSLDEARPDSRITVIGHSYGSIVTSIAAAHGMPADQVVLIGSPGVPVDSAEGFMRVDGGHPAVFVGQNSTDHIAIGSDLLGWGDDSYHGTNPMADGFGAADRRSFSTSGFEHSYFDADSEQLRWLGDIIRPSPDLSNANLA